MPTINGLTDLGLLQTLRELMQDSGEFADLFRQDAVAAGALRAITGNIGAVELGAWTGPERDEDRVRATGASATSLETLLADPDGQDIDGGDLIDLLIEWFLDDGESHIVMRDALYQPVRTPDDRPTFLTIHGAQEIQPDVYGRRALKWWLNDDRYTGRRFEVPDAAHLVVKKPDKDHPYRGFGICRVIAPTGEIGWLAKSYLRAYFKNGADPGGIITLESSPGAKAIADLKKQWIDRHGGASNANTPAVLTDGATYQQTTKTHQEMQLTEMLRTWQREDVLLALNVPESELGRASPQTYSNGISANGQFWNMLFTIMRQIENALNNPRKGLGRRYGLHVGWDYGAVKTVLENATSKIDSFAKAVANGIPINTAKRLVNLRVPDVNGGDIALVSSALIPVTATPTSPAALGGMAGPDIEEPAMPGPAKPPEGSSDEVAEDEIEDTDEPVAADPPAKSARLSAMRARHRAAQASAVVRLRKTAAVSYAREYRRVVLAMRKEALDAFDEGARAAGQVRAPSTLVDAAKWVAEWERTVTELVEAALLDAGEGVADEIGHELTVYDLAHPAAVAYAAAKRSQIRDVPEQIREAVTAAVAEGVAANEHPDELKRRLKGAFNAESSRLEAVARTESGEAISTGRFVAMDAEGVTEHEWSAFASPESRHAGTAVDGEIVRIGTAFSNGLRYPLDPAGSAAETVNCRCVSLAVE